MADPQVVVVGQESNVPSPSSSPLDLSQPIFSLSRNITVRAYRSSDAEALAYHGNNRRIARNMLDTWPVPYTMEASRGWVARCLDESNWAPTIRASAESSARIPKLPRSWVIALDDQPIGSCGLKLPGDVHGHVAVLGYWIGEEHWGKGIITEVVTALIEWTWKTYAHIMKIEAEVFGWNPASGRVLLKTGLREEARQRAKVCKFGEYCDLISYGLVREGVRVVDA